MEEDKGVVQDEQVQVAVEQSDVSDQVVADNSKEINWQKANHTMAEQSSELRTLRAELNALRNPVVKEKEFDGKDDDDLSTIADLKKAFSQADQKHSEQLAELRAKAKYPDFEKIVSNYGKKLPESVRSAIMHSSDPYAAAYEACKDSTAYYKDQLSNVKHDYAKKAEDNLKKPGSASSAGNNGTVSQGSVYKNMSLAEMRAMTSNRASGG